MKYLFTILFIFYFSFSYSQKEDYNWVFFKNIHIGFNTNPPTVSTVPNILTTRNCTSISDKDGNLLFYSDVSKIYNSEHELIVDIGWTSAKSRAINVVPHPIIEKTFFYISGVKINAQKQFIYLVNMNANAGKGKATKVSIMNDYLVYNFLIIRKYNSKDYWFLRFKDNKIIRNTIDESGLKDDISIENFMKVSRVLISPDMSKLFILDYNRTKFYIADYDYRTAEIKNIKQFKEDKEANGISKLFEFSRDGNYLFYITQKAMKGDTIKTIAIKYDMSKVSNIQDFSNSADTLPIINPTKIKNEQPLDVSSAPNGNIYIVVLKAGYLLAIEEDNTVDGGYVLNKKSLYLNGNKSGALPHFFIYHVCFNYNLDCNTSTFNYLGMPAQNQLWDFGDGTTSTELNPTHTYPVAGTYAVKLIATYTDGTTQTATKPITISKRPKKPVILHD